MRFVAVALIAFPVLAIATAMADETITRGGNISVDVAKDGRLAFDLAGDIWVVPGNGGEAQPVTSKLKSAQRPRWSPDARRIAYQAVGGVSQGLWVYDIATRQASPVSRGSYFDLHPAWHPDNERLVYASDRTGSGFDLWEVDLPTGLHWRLSHRPGDETDPAWSADGRDLVYVHRLAGQWSLVLRKHGRAEEVLLSTSDRLAGPSWRPDGSLITYYRQDDSGTSIEMIILSQPRLIRAYASDEEFVLAPLSWLDRHRMFYTANGEIRRRQFDSWTSTPVPFRATIRTQAATAPDPRERRQLARIDEPPGTLVIHASRMFDGLGDGYRTDVDIVIDRGRIAAVEPHHDRPGSIVIRMDGLTVMPGYIDAAASLPERPDDGFGPLLLTTGVTTLVTRHADIDRLNTLWSGKMTPGPRLMRAADGDSGPVSGLADSMTPRLDALLQSRQADLIGHRMPVARRFADTPVIDAGASSVVLGSKANGLPAGIALHAELRALVAARLKPEQALRAAGANAAAALRVDPFLGRIAVGAVADLVFVDGDPLGNVDDALNVIAVVRNGRFFSVSGLIERAQTAESVE